VINKKRNYWKLNNFVAIQYAFRKNPTALKIVSDCVKEMMITLSGKASLYLPRRWGNKNLVNTNEISWSKNSEDPSKSFHCCENLKSDKMCSRNSVIRPFFCFRT
jgi:hypothetical protein